MKSVMSRVLGVGCVSALVLTGTSAGHAQVVETPPEAVSSATVSVAMDNDWQFADAECLFIPILATFGRADDTSLLGETLITKADSEGTANEGTFLVLPGDPVSGQLLDEVFVCPADGTGEYRLTTVIRAIEPDAEQAFSLDPLTFWVRPATSKMTSLVARSTKGGVRITGDVSAGDSVATGVVRIRYRTPTADRWRTITSVPVEEGSFTALVEQSLPPKTRFQATLTGCSWCSRVSAVVRDVQ